MKILALSLLTFATLNAGATTGVDLYVTPEQPVIISADLVLDSGTEWETVIRAPWFQGSYTVLNDSGGPITVIGLAIVATSTEGQVTSHSYKFGKSFELEPGDGLRVIDIYIDGLAASASPVYNVSVELQGWAGKKNVPGDRLTVIRSFVTR